MRNGAVERESAAPRAPKPAPILTRQLWIVVATHALFSLGWSVYLILPKFLTVALGADAKAIGYVNGVAGLASITFVPVVTSLIDRGGRRALLQVGCALLALVSFLFPFVDRLGPLVFVLAAGTGAAFVFAWNAAATLVADAAAPERLGQALAIVGGAGSLTNSLSTLAAEHIASAAGWPLVFVGAGVCALAALAVTLAIAERSEPRAHAHVVAQPWLSGPVLRVLVVSLLMGAIFAAMFEFHQPYALFLGASNVAPFFAGFTVSTVAVRVLFGTAGDRFGHRRVAMVASLAYGAAALATAALQIRWLFGFGAGFGLAHGVLYPTLNALAIEWVPARVRGRVITLFNGAFRGGFALSMLAWGNVAKAFGYPSLFVVASVLGVVSAAIVATIGTPHPAISGRAPRRDAQRCPGS